MNDLKLPAFQTKEQRDTKFPSLWKNQDSAIPIVRIIPIVGSHFGNRIFLLVFVFEGSDDPL